MERKSARRWLIRGGVQGVGFRFFVQQKATALGLTGWARNLDDGTVEVYAAGTEAGLSDLAGALHVGPSMAAVRSVEEEPAPAGSHTSFSVR